MKMPDHIMLVLRPAVLVAFLILGFAAAVSASTPAGSESDLVRQALAATDEGSSDDWAYTETAVENGRETVRRFDPRRPSGERWKLVSVDGRPPTDAERDEDAKRRPEERQGPDPDAADAEEGTIRAMVEPESLSLIENTETHATYRFDPVAEDEEDAELFRHLDATLRIAKNGPYVASVDMRSRKPFSLGFGVKVREFSMSMSFEPVDAGGPVLPRMVMVRMLGRAFLVKKIDETSVVSYGDYEFVGK